MWIPLAATTAVAAAGAYAYAANWPTSQLFGKTIVAGDDPAEIALTFDDGPNGELTLRLLDVLARHEVRATFFMIGNFVRQQPATVRAVRDAGHLIGNHTMAHPVLLWQRPARVLEELAGCNQVIEDLLGEPVRYFRPPHGARRPDILRTAQALGLTPVLWNVTCYDWKQTEPAGILQKARTRIAANQRKGIGSNLLLHDGGHRATGADRWGTVTATDTFLSELDYSAVRFVTPDAWG